MKEAAPYVEGALFPGGSPKNSVNSAAAEGLSAVRAIEPATGVMKWEFKMRNVTTSGILITASNVLFTGGRDGYFHAIDARTGAPLWRATIGGLTEMGPMTYAVAGRQYVAVASGSSLFTFALRQ